MLGSAIRRILRFSRDQRHVMRAAVVVAGYLFVAKAIVAGREIAVAWRFGVSAEADAFQLALTIATWVPLLVGTIAPIVLVPYIISLKDCGERSTFLKDMVLVAVLLGAFLTLFVFAASGFAVEILAGDLTAGTRTMAAAMVLHMLPATFFMIIALFYTARLQASGNLSFGVWEAGPALGLIVLLALTPPPGGATALAVGTSLGSGVQAVALIIVAMFWYPLAKARGALFHTAAWRPLLSGLGVLAAGQVLISLALPIDQAFAARTGTGGVSQLGYAQRGLGLVAAMGTIIIARALLPAFSTRVSNAEWAAGRREARQWSHVMFWAGIAIAGIGWLAAPLVVRLLFERGAFSTQDTDAVAWLVRLGLLQFPFFLAGNVMVQWFAALGRHSLLALACAISVPVKLVANFSLTPLMGVAGIVVGTVIMYLVTFLVLQIAWHKSGTQRSDPAGAIGGLR